MGSSNIGTRYPHRAVRHEQHAPAYDIAYTSSAHFLERASLSIHTGPCTLAGNQFRALEEDEVLFLDSVLEKQREEERLRKEMDGEELKNFRQ